MGPTTCAAAAISGGGQGSNNGLMLANFTSMLPLVFGEILGDFPITAGGGSGQFDQFVPDNQLPLAARPLLSGNRTLNPDGTITVTPPDGYLVRISDNNQGLVFYPPINDFLPPPFNNQSIIRVSMANASNPAGYIRYYNIFGQPISPFSGLVGSNNNTHYVLGGFGPVQ